MDIESLWKFGMTLPHATYRSPFGPDTLALEIGGKMFALLDLSAEWNFYNIKVDIDRGIELRDRYDSIRPAYHMDKQRWISVDFDGHLPDSMHHQLLIDSYREVLRGMSRKKRSSLLEFNIRPSVTADIPRLLEIFTKAKQFMRQQGNMEQWQGEYPGTTALLSDIAHGWSMVVEHCGEIVGTFCMMTDPEPTYHNLTSSGDYITLHRVASSGAVSGIVDVAVGYALQHSHAVRIDTHPHNRAMLKSIKRLRMQPLGEITLADGTPRLVFETGS